MTYIEKLQSPEWQKKRLEVFKRDSFKCKHCGSKDDQLHVHHKTYIWGNDPWQYPMSNFETLCKHCHEAEEGAKVDFNDLVHDLLMMGYDYRQLHIALNSFHKSNAIEQKEQTNG